ncbi:hypothetical protein BB559_005728 [Furculomyces boomerangus]|uniref:Uncharacterized protein n=1 Tax=Furculomyces boomerangus TaxID=61424 RepID=A0A2T9Y6X9_9FUNG|nr:hypothetical protein BB559_005957 [Furculomyces boomerangus]PVU88109.1 hypothetical protein BB559_005728 [Furculomyces boomerangus]
MDNQPQPTNQPPPNFRTPTPDILPNPPKGWYWLVQPGKYINEEYQKITNPLECNSCHQFSFFTRDSNNTGRNTYCCFKCTSCRVKQRATDFFIDVMERSTIELPPTTNIDALYYFPQKSQKRLTNNTSTASTSRNNPTTPIYPTIPTFPATPIFPTMPTISAPTFPHTSIEYTDNTTQPTETQSSIPETQIPETQISETQDSLGDEYMDELERRLNKSKENAKPVARKRYAEDPSSQQETDIGIKNQLEIFMASVKTLISKSISTALASKSTPAIQSENSINSFGYSLKGMPRLADSESTSIKALKAENQQNTPMLKLKLATIPTFAEIARSRIKNGTKEEVDKLHSAIRKIAGVKPLGTGTRAEVKHKVARLYIQGISRQPIREVKESFAIMRFKLSKILNMDFIGRSTMEITVMEEYARGLVAHTKAFPFLTVLSKVDPAKPMNPEATQLTKDLIRQAFYRRIQASVEKTTKPIFKQYLLDLANELAIPLLPQNISNDIISDIEMPEEPCINKELHNEI